VAEKDKVNAFVKDFTTVLVKHDVSIIINPINVTMLGGDQKPNGDPQNVKLYELNIIGKDFKLEADDLRRRVFQHSNKAIAKKYRPKGLSVTTSAIATVIKHKPKK